MCDDVIVSSPPVVGPIAAQAYGKCVGVGPLAIFLHGYPSSSSEWSFVAGPLVSAGYRVLLLDMPGFGRSEGTRFGARSELNTSKNGE